MNWGLGVGNFFTWIYVVVNLKYVEFVLIIKVLKHSSEIRGLCLMKCPSDKLQNMPHMYLEYENLSTCVFACFSFCATLFSL